MNNFKKSFLLFLLSSLFLLQGLVIPGHGSSGWGHLGQSVYLMAIEMPRHPDIYKTALGKELFQRLTSMDENGACHFDLDHLNPEQQAFTLGAVGPDKFDITQALKLSKVFFPLHKLYPQKALNLLSDLTMAAKGDQFLVARAYYFGWAFHYMGDIVIHPGMNVPNELRLGRDYAAHGPEHVVFESLLDKIAVYYWFLKNHETGIYPSAIIHKVGVIKPITLTWKMMISSMHRMFQNVKLDVVALCKTIFSTNRKVSENAFRNAMKKKEFLANALYDESLKRFVKEGVPEAEIMNGKVKLSDYFPADIHARTSAMEGVRWFNRVIESARTGFIRALTRKGFNINLDYGTPTPEPEMTDKDKSILIKLYHSSMKKCLPDQLEFLYSDDL